VRDIGAHPGLGGYLYTIDECISTLIPGAFAQYDRLRRSGSRQPHVHDELRPTAT
jgi:hypothetical protein